MFTDTATKILRKASPRFEFINRHRIYKEPIVDARAMELGVWFGGQLLGYLEHNEMPERRSIDEVLAVYYDTRGGKGVGRVRAPYGIQWEPSAHDAAGYRHYIRASWQDCFRKIVGKVPPQVQGRIRRGLAREGYKL